MILFLYPIFSIVLLDIHVKETWIVLLDIHVKETWIVLLDIQVKETVDVVSNDTFYDVWFTRVHLCDQGCTS